MKPTRNAASTTTSGHSDWRGSTPAPRAQSGMSPSTDALLERQPPKAVGAEPNLSSGRRSTSSAEGSQTLIPEPKRAPAGADPERQASAARTTTCRRCRTPQLVPPVARPPIRPHRMYGPRSPRSPAWSDRHASSTRTPQSPLASCDQLVNLIPASASGRLRVRGLCKVCR